MSIAVERRPQGYAVLSLQKEPVNAMDLAFWTQLSLTINALEKDSKIKGIVICSGLVKDIFTAGNDIAELYAPNTSLARYKTFWKTSNTCLAQLLVSPLITVAAIRGECPAGGCMLSLCCDYRLMTNFGRIGLNEVVLGIPVPGYWAELFGRTMGYGHARGLLLSGTMVPSSEALELNLIHEMCSKEDLLHQAESFMLKALELPMEGRIGTKERMFKKFAEDWIKALDEESEWAFSFLSRPQNVAFLKSVLQRLSKKKSRL